jgi:hypothetical protein
MLKKKNWPSFQGSLRDVCEMVRPIESQEDRRFKDFRQEMEEEDDFHSGVCTRFLDIIAPITIE